jgi:hypothetical protein
MRNSELTHILGCCHAYFPLNFWLPRVVLQLSFECLEFLLDFNMREWTLWVGPRFTWTSLPSSHQEIIWSEWTWAWWSLELVLKLLASKNKDQFPLPDHLEDHLIWVDSIKVIPLDFTQYVVCMPSRIPQLIPATLTLFIQLKHKGTQQHVYLLLPVMHITWHSFYCILRFYLLSTVKIVGCPIR